MSERTFFDSLLIFWFVLAVVVFAVLLRLPAPYGRHAREGWGPMLDTRVGWLVMEAPAPVFFLLLFLAGSSPRSTTLLVFFGMWQAHYIHRAFLYPLSLSGTTKRIPFFVVASGILFNTVNAYLNGRHLFTLSAGYPERWLSDPRLVIGVTLFIGGYILNRYSDRTLRSQRSRTGQRYCLINEGIFRYVCCPNYLGEILIWVGWAVATWSLAGLSFAVWAAANLLPRARTHLQWCRDYFMEYPAGRKAVLPGLW